MKNGAQKLGESFLYHIWDGGHLRHDRLRTRDNRRVEILFRGRWNMDTGPDFKGAVIKIDDELQKGDVEIHLNDRDWYLHSHHQDERYNEVILHAVLSVQEEEKPCHTLSGRSVPTLVLGDFLDESVSRLQTRVDLHSGPAGKKWPEVCLLGSKPLRQILNTLEHWGGERLRLKKERFKEEREFFQFNDLLYQGICEALGYAKNREPFLKLSLLLPLSVVWEELDSCTSEEAIWLLQGMFFGTAGMLGHSEKGPSPPSIEVDQFLQRLKFYWCNFREKTHQNQMQFVEWQFFRLRPMNFPTVRIAGLCQYLLSRRHTGLLDPLLFIFRDLRRTPGKIFSSLQKHFLVNSFGFWRNHFHFVESRTVPKDYRLIGPAKTREIVMNVVLPVLLAYGEESEDYELQNLVKMASLRAPSLESNQLTRKMQRQLKLETRPDLKLTACQQQGMLHLARLFCPRWHCQHCLQPPM